MFSGNRAAVRAACLFFALSAILFAPALLFGTIYSGGDLPFHVSWSYQFAAALREGILYPRWAPISNFGLGQPVFMYYNPISFYLIGFLSLAGIDPWLGIRILEVLANGAVGFCAYLLCRRYLPERFAMLAGVVLQLSPFGMLSLLSFGQLPSYTGTALGVISLLLLARLAQSQERISIGFSVAIGLLTATHLLSSFMVLLCLPVACAASYFLADGRDVRAAARRTWAIGVSAVLGLGLAAAYLVPALLDLRYIRPSGWTDLGPQWDYRSNFTFPLLGRLLLPSSFPTLQWLIPAALLLTLAIGAWCVYRFPGESVGGRRWALTLAAIAVWGLFLSSSFSLLLWRVAGPLRMLQFPWRWNYVVTIACVPLCVYALRTVYRLPGAKQYRLVCLLPLLFLAGGGVGILAKMYVRQPHAAFAAPSIQSDTGAPEYQPVDAGKTDEYLRAGGFAAECAQAQATCEVFDTKSNRRGWRVTAAQPVELRLPVSAYRSWSLGVNGEEQRLRHDAATGLAVAAVPQGRSEVVLRWKVMPEEVAGRAISVASGLVLLGLAAFRRRRRVGPGDLVGAAAGPGKSRGRG